MQKAPLLVPLDFADSLRWWLMKQSRLRPLWPKYPTRNNVKKMSKSFEKPIDNQVTAWYNIVK